VPRTSGALDRARRSSSPCGGPSLSSWPTGTPPKGQYFFPGHRIFESWISQKPKDWVGLGVFRLQNFRTCLNNSHTVQQMSHRPSPHPLPAGALRLRNAECVAQAGYADRSHWCLQVFFFLDQMGAPLLADLLFSLPLYLNLYCMFHEYEPCLQYFNTHIQLVLVNQLAGKKHNPLSSSPAQLSTTLNHNSHNTAHQCFVVLFPSDILAPKTHKTATRKPSRGPHASTPPSRDPHCSPPPPPAPALSGGRVGGSPRVAGGTAPLPVGRRRLPRPRPPAQPRARSCEGPRSHCPLENILPPLSEHEKSRPR